MPNIDQLKKDVDLFWEHSKHTTYQPKCSTCFSENQGVKASVEKGRDNHIGRLMTYIIWGETGDWIDPSFRKW